MAEVEKVTPVQLEQNDSSSAERGVDKSGIEYERAQLLAALPDPDAGKTEAERAEIVSNMLSLLLKTILTL